MNEGTLNDLTKRYWDKIREEPENTEEILKKYIANLLPGELAWAEEHPVPETGKPRIPTQGCDELILLVGFSIEPLLQSVWVYNPRYVILLLNSNYCGQNAETFGKMVRRLIEHLHETRKRSHQDTRDTITVIMRELPLEPSPVFNELRQIVSPPDQVIEDLRGEKHTIDTPPERVIIDITGGKKKMVAEAFLYAAYANIDVSYVDFDDDKYDETRRRPYGYCCRIGRLKNPYSAFALRDWERVRDLYDKYNFRAAKTALEELKDNLRKAEMDFLVDDMEEATRKLDKLLDCYEAWDSGDFNKAKALADEISQGGWIHDFPSVITTFGGKWFDIDIEAVKKGRRNKIYKNLPEYFFDDASELRTYIYDELKRVKRLHKNENNRSAFLRAAGLNEVIMIARLVRLIRDKAARQLFLQTMGRWRTIAAIYEILLKDSGSSITIDSKIIQCASPINVTLPISMNKWWQKKTKYFTHPESWRTFLHLRNKMTHAYFTVSQDLAKDALCFVKANFEDFLDMTIEKLEDALNLSASTLSWEEVCKRCGLDKHLPLNLRRNP